MPITSQKKEGKSRTKFITNHRQMEEKKVKRRRSAKDPDSEEPALPKPVRAKRPGKKVDEDVAEGEEKMDDAVATKKRKSKTAKADVEVAAEPAAEGEEKQAKKKKKPGKLAGLFDKSKSD